MKNLLAKHGIHTQQDLADAYESCYICKIQDIYWNGENWNDDIIDSKNDEFYALASKAIYEILVESLENMGFQYLAETFEEQTYTSALAHINEARASLSEEEFTTGEYNKAISIIENI